MLKNKKIQIHKKRRTKNHPRGLTSLNIHLHSSNTTLPWRISRSLLLCSISSIFRRQKMHLRILHCTSSTTAQIHNPKLLKPLSHSRPSFLFTPHSLSRPTIRICSSSSRLSVDVSPRSIRRFAIPQDREGSSSLEIENETDDEDELGSRGLWSQMKEIVSFTGPAIGLWICGPLMSLIDTAVIGQGSAVELAALGIYSSEFLLV